MRLSLSLLLLQGAKAGARAVGVKAVGARVGVRADGARDGAKDGARGVGDGKGADADSCERGKRS
jgi:hypothetical protein